MKVALIQMDSKDNKRENIEKAIKFMDEAVKKDSDIICLSEKFLYWGKDRGAESMDSDIITNFKEYAKKNNFKSIYLTCLDTEYNAHKLYESIGFKKASSIKYNLLV